MNKTYLELCVRKCDKLESDDFRNKMKNEFELICKAFNESKMPSVAGMAVYGYSLPEVYGGTGRAVGVEESGRERKREEKKRGKEKHSLSCG